VEEATKGDSEMKKGWFTEEQIIGILKQHEAGRKVPDLAREIGVSTATIYTWKSKYGGMDVSDAQKLEAARLPNGPRADTLLDVRRQLPKVMPKLHDRLGCRLPATIVDGMLT
jgi:putative transposase